MSRKYFGTDGIRGTANAPPMTAELALTVGMAAGVIFRRGGHRHQVVIGKDTRLSGYMLEPALTAGFAAMGMDVFLLGPVPTPAIAMLTRSMRADLGVMLSASHNAYADNGIKLFGPDGYKLSDDTEAEIERLMGSDLAPMRAPPEKLGRVRRLDDGLSRYNEFVKNTLPRDLRLDGLKIVVDCAHGAAYKVAPRVLWELGAEVIALGVSPDGFNINQDCGSTHPQAVAQRVVAERAHFGLALDGDADRVIVIDEKGAIIDGDQLLALIAEQWLKAGKLKGKGVVATVMSNLGLERFLKQQGLDLRRVAVGDRYVVEAMREGGFNVGGEQSGHIVLSDFTTTGDGLMAALQVLAAMVRSGKPASEICRRFATVPQLLKNVVVNGGDPLARAEVKQAIAAGEKALNGRGRLLIRKSGTEAKIRVMAEGDDAALVQRVVDDIAGAISKAAR